MHLTAIVLTAALLAAQPDAKAEVRARAIAPFLDAQTVAVAHADLTRLDIDKIKPLIDLLGFRERDTKDGGAPDVHGVLSALVKAGAKEMFLVASLADIPGQPPFAVVPVRDGADDKAIAAALKQGKVFDATGRFGTAVVGGGKNTIARLQELKPVPRPEVARGFAAAGDSAVRVVVMPTADLRRTFEEVFATLPKELGGGPGKVLTRGVVWAALGADLSPQPSLRLVIQSADAAAAKELGSVIERMLETVSHEKGAREVFPDIDKLRSSLTPKVENDRLSLTVDEKTIAAVAGPLLTRTEGAAVRGDSANKLKQIGLAMHNYHDTHRAFPPAFSRDKQGKPLLSWRVHVLPFLDQEALYKEFRLNEPWDSEHNQKLIARMPAVYRGANQKLADEGRTPFVVPVGAATIFTGGPKGLRVAEVSDGTSHTALAVEADDAHAVIWTKPDDLKFDPKQPQAGLAEYKPGGFAILMGDGSVHFLPATIDKKTLAAIFTRNGGEVVKWP